MTTDQFECWEFYGQGDPFFGGNADDRVLYRLPTGTLSFIARCSLPTGAVRATFETKAAALAAGHAATTRNGLISAHVALASIQAEGRS